jgi:phospholipase C
MSEWPRHKDNHSMGYFTEADMPFQFALAEAFTICAFLWTGTNDPLQRDGGPVIYNQYDNVNYDSAGGYTWLTYCERLQAAGISWGRRTISFSSPIARCATFRACACSGTYWFKRWGSELGRGAQSLTAEKRPPRASRLAAESSSGSAPASFAAPQSSTHEQR